jgi:site-specific DNA-methyltransferase (adenine-specific)
MRPLRRNIFWRGRRAGVIIRPMPKSAIPQDQIVQGDCLKTMAAWPEHAIDLIFADPPYNIGYNYDEYEDKRDDHDYIAWTENWISACARLLKPTGSFYVLIGDEYAAEVRMHLKKLERQRQLTVRNWIIWHYTFGQNCKVKFNRSHAHLFYCVGSALADGGKVKLDDLPFTFNREAIAVPSARQLIYADARANPSGKLPDDTWYLRPQEADGMLKPEDDTWYVSRLCGTFRERAQWHPCQLPEALLERVIKVSSNPGDLVFDPFTGSGSTLRVARRLGRHWLGCELSESYAQQALKRVMEDEAPRGPVITRNGLRAGAGRKRRKAVARG